jgi:hypothetical protein
MERNDSVHCDGITVYKMFNNKQISNTYIGYINSTKTYVLSPIIIKYEAVEYVSLFDVHPHIKSHQLVNGC